MNTTPVARLPPAGVPLFIILATLLVALPTAAAQVPPLPTTPDPEQDVLAIAISSGPGIVQVPYNGNGQTSITVLDLSQDAGTNPTTGGAKAKPHIVSLSLLNVEEVQAAGWLVQFGPSAVQTFGGDSAPIEVNFVTTPQINQHQITATLVAELYDAQTQRSVNATINLTGEVQRYSRALARIPVSSLSQTAEQFQMVRYEVVVQNDAVYPDVFAIEATLDKEGFVVIAPGTIYVPPMETRSFNVTVRTPYGTFYEFGNSATLNVKVASVYTGATYTTTGLLRVEGFYVSTYWLPLLVVGLISAGIVTRDRRRNSELRRLEKGRPRRVQPTPRQAVLLAELKRKDPESYQEKKARMDALYKMRRETYRDERQRVVEADKHERRAAKAEYAAAIRRKKAERIAAKAQAKVDAKEARRQRKIDKKATKAQARIDKKQAKADAKERKRLEKQIARKRKVLEKARAKAAKAEAKQAKAQARADKKAARAATRSAKGRDGKP